MMQLDSAPMNFPSNLILHISTLKALEGEQAYPTWSAAAAALSRLSEGPISAGLVSGSAAMQHASGDLLRAYRDAEPKGVRHTEAESACKGISEQWPGGPDLGSLDKLLLLGALADNPALSGMERALKLSAMRSGNDAWGLLCDARESEEARACPRGFEGSIRSTLARPALAAPHELDEQLEWVLEHWAPYLTSATRELVLLARDLLSEETRARFGGTGPVAPPALDAGIGLGGGAHFGAPGTPGYVDGKARFSDDAHWMPRLVMLAKQTYVWLDQLSKRYEREITRLDQIPDAELEHIASQGFDGLWLIGLWERSGASREIKVRRGNQEAEASATHYATTR